MVNLICKDHPKYNAIYQPKIDCIICWKIYAAKLKKKLKDFKNAK